MWPYLLFICVPAAFALRGGPPGTAARVFVFSLYVFFAGFRYQVGPDWLGYYGLHQAMRRFDYSDIVTQGEPLARLLFKWSVETTNSMIISNVVAAIILTGGVFYFARRTGDPWLAVLSATPYLIVAFGMSGIRQGMAAGILLYVLAHGDRWSIVAQVGGVVVACLFHASGIIGISFILINWRTSAVLKYGIMILSLSVSAYYAINQNDSTDSVYSGYASNYFGTRQIDSIGSLFHISFIVIPAVMGWRYRSVIYTKVPFPDLLRGGFAASVAVAIFNIVSSTGASRLTIYLYFVPMMVYPAIAALQKRGAAKFRIIFAAAHIFILSAWLMFANNSFAHLPYQNYLFCPCEDKYGVD